MFVKDVTKLVIRIPALGRIDGNHGSGIAGGLIKGEGLFRAFFDIDGDLSVVRVDGFLKRKMRIVFPHVKGFAEHGAQVRAPKTLPRQEGILMEMR